MVLSDSLLQAARSLLLVAVAAMSCFIQPAFADDLQDAGKLLREGQAQQALERVNKILSARPKDPQARFLRGLILTDQGNAKDAIDVFQKLTQDHPELPEPYNNLAVIYAAQGQYDRARGALEQSIRTHPSYATAYENLGDVYAKLASQAYDKALQIDTSNTGAKQKLALVRELVGGAQSPKPGRAPVVVAAAEPQKKSAESPSNPSHPASPAAKPAQPAGATPAAAPANAPAAVAASVAPPSGKTSASASVDKASPSDAEIIAALTDWAKAWSRKDVEGYLSHYAKAFKTPGGQSRSAWEKSRRERLLAPKSISVSISNPKVRMTGDKEASVTFRQSYRSDALQANGGKQVVMVKSGDRWMIQQEKVAN